MPDTDKTQIDPLTGLLNHETFDDLLAEAVGRADELSQPLSLALFDIDHFLLVNQDYGHDGGDQVLQAIASALTHCLSPSELGARIGGDEFAVLMPDTDREQAFLILERLRVEVSGLEIDCGKQVIRGIGISGGVASYPIDGSSPTELLRKADQALYRAKVSGRNRIRLAYEEKMVPKTSHYTQTQLERLSLLAKQEGVGEAELLREALDGLLLKYGVDKIES